MCLYVYECALLEMCVCVFCVTFPALASSYLLKKNDDIVTDNFIKENILNILFCDQILIHETNAETPVFNDLINNLSHIEILNMENEDVLKSLPLGKNGRA